MLYVNMCDTAVDLFSRCYFKEYFFLPLIGLSGKTVGKHQKVQDKIGRHLAKYKITSLSI
jgi:hypothetical protein